MKSRSVRRGAISRGLVVALGAVLLLVGGFWAWRWYDTPSVAAPGATADPNVVVYCDACKQQQTMKRSEYRALEFDASNACKCPKCGAFKLQVFRERGTILPPGRAGG